MGVGDVLPLLAMVLVQIGYAGMNITSKLAMDSGMKPLVLVAYRQIFAAIALIPFAYFFERKTRPKITSHILFQIFLSSLTGATANQVFYFVGLEMSTPTISCALSNILPAVTFILAVFFRQEHVAIKRMSGQAKVLGTIVCVGGAMLLSFYHGHIIGISESSIHWKYAERVMKNTKTTSKSSSSLNSILGPCFVMASSTAWALWFIIQARMSKSFPAPYTSTGLMCFMSSIQCVGIALFDTHDVSAWSLKSSIRTTAAVYAGVVASALAFCLTSWSIQRKGPLYVSVFSPLLLVIVAVLSWALLREKLYVGTVVGSILIVAGLYAVLWGKGKEVEVEEGIEDGDDIEAKQEANGYKNLELQFQAHFPGNTR